MAPSLFKTSCHDLECQAPTNLHREVLPLKTGSNAQTLSHVLFLYPFPHLGTCPLLILRALTRTSISGYIYIYYILACFSSSLNEHTLSYSSLYFLCLTHFLTHNKNNLFLKLTQHCKSTTLQ